MTSRLYHCPTVDDALTYLNHRHYSPRTVAIEFLGTGLSLSFPYTRTATYSIGREWKARTRGGDGNHDVLTETDLEIDINEW